MLAAGNSRPRFSFFVAAALGTVLAGAPSPAAGQNRQSDARWQPWLGCWTPLEQAVPPETSARHVCVVAAEGVSAVDIVTVDGSRIVSREHIEANGMRRTGGREGCTGWESAVWSSDAQRVYLKSQYECTGGVKRNTTGLMATTSRGDWIDIVGVAMRDGIGVRVLRHRPIAPGATLPPEIANAQPAGSSATAAGAPIADADIVEASRHVSAQVVEAWLAESRQLFTTSARRLVAMADAGVDSRVLDMIVALSNPKAFSIRPSPTEVGSLATSQRSGGGGGVGFGSSFDCGPYLSGLSLYGWDDCSPYGYALYGPAYGFSSYRNLLGYGGWYVAGGEGAVVLVRPSDTSSSHGKVINGRGYSSGGDSGGSATSSGGSSGGSSGTAGGGGGGASSGGARTAVPR